MRFLKYTTKENVISTVWRKGIILGRKRVFCQRHETYERAVQAAKELWRFEMGNASDLRWEKVKDNWY